MGTGTSSGADKDSNGWGSVQGLAMKTLVLIGGALLVKRLTKSTTRWDHARLVSQSLTGEKFSRDQASRDPDNYFNIRMFLCPAAEMVDGSKVLYFEQLDMFPLLFVARHSGELPKNPSDRAAAEVLLEELKNWIVFRRFYMVKPCPKESKCDVEVSTYAIRDAEEYKNFCDRATDQRPLPEEVIGDIAEHLTTLHLKRCDRGKRCLYEGSTPAGGFPNTWNGATYCTSELAVLKNNEVHMWDRGYDDAGNQVWGARERAYEFKPAPASRSLNGIVSSLNFPLAQSIDKKIEGSRDLEN
ncbi:Chromophore lyase CRL, chloroplastic [Linum grandiflorum]